eukprot:gene13569-biopygen13390
MRSSAKRTQHSLILLYPAVWQALPPRIQLRSMIQVIWAVERVGLVPAVAIARLLQPLQAHTPRATLQPRAQHRLGEPSLSDFRYTPLADCGGHGPALADSGRLSAWLAGFSRIGLVRRSERFSCHSPRGSEQFPFHSPRGSELLTLWDDCPDVPSVPDSGGLRCAGWRTWRTLCTWLADLADWGRQVWRTLADSVGSGGLCGLGGL